MMGTNSTQDYFVRNNNVVQQLANQSARSKNKIKLSDGQTNDLFIFFNSIQGSVQSRYNTVPLDRNIFCNSLTNDPVVGQYFTTIGLNPNFDFAITVANGMQNFASSGFSRCKQAVDQVMQKYGEIDGLQGYIDDLQEQILAVELDMYRTFQDIDQKLRDTDGCQNSSIYSELTRLFEDFQSYKEQCQSIVSDFEDRAEDYLKSGCFIFVNKDNSDEITENEAGVLDLKMSKALINQIVRECHLSNNERKEAGENLLEVFLLDDQEDENIEKVFGIKDFTTALFCAADNAVNKYKEDICGNIEKKRIVSDKLNNLEKVSEQLIKKAMDVYEEGRRRVEKFKNIDAEAREQIDCEYYLILVNMHKCIEGNLATLEQLKNEVDSCDRNKYEKDSIKKRIEAIRKKLLSQQKKCESKGQKFKNYKYDLNQLKLNNQSPVLNLNSCRKTLLNQDTYL